MNTGSVGRLHRRFIGGCDDGTTVGCLLGFLEGKALGCEVECLDGHWMGCDVG